MISSTLRLYDCDSHIDGSTAIVLSVCDANGGYGFGAMLLRRD